MPRSSRIAFWLALLALMMPTFAPASSQAVHKKSGKKAQSRIAEPVRPPLPEELPPVAPTVTFRGGQLTITAPNSTLLDVLSAVRKATGAAVDAPAATAEVRVATHLGPGRPRAVLSALLDGSKFDYILLGSAQDPASVSRLILSLRSGGGDALSPGGPGSPAGELFSRPARPISPTDAGDDESAPPEPTVEPAEVAPEPETAPPPEVKTPGQLQEEMRQQQEQQRQQQQQQQQQEPQQEPPQ